MAGNRRRWPARGAAFVWGACLVATASCGLPEFFVNNTISLGGPTPGGRGNIQVTLVNNTQYFVSMTFGAYDPLDEGLVPDYQQVFADSDHPEQRIEPGTTSPTFTFINTRSFSLGDRGLIQAIRDRDSEADLATLSEGITLSDKLLDAEGVQQFTLNGVANQVQLLGINYQVESLLIFKLQPDAAQPDGVRIDVDVVLP